MDSIIKLTDYFDELKIDIFDYTKETLEKSYRQFAKKYHPDKNFSGEEKFKQFTEIKDELKYDDDGKLILLQSKNVKQLELAVEAFKNKFTFLSKEYIEHVEFINNNKNKKHTDESVKKSSKPSLVKLILYYMNHLQDNSNKFLNKMLKILLKGTKNDKIEMSIKIIDYCDILKLGVKDITNAASISEDLYIELSRNLNEEQLKELEGKRENVIGLLEKRPTLFNDYININDTNMDFFIEVFRKKYDYKSPTYVRMENLIEEELYYLSSNQTKMSKNNVPFLCSLFIHYLKSLKINAKKEVLQKLSQKFSPKELFHEDRLTLQSHSFSSSSSSKNVLAMEPPKEPIPGKCKEKTTKYYGKGQCLSTGLFMRAILDTLVKNRDIDSELERGIKEITKNSGKIDNSPEIHKLLDSGLLPETSTIFLRSMINPSFQSHKKKSSNKVSSTKPQECKSPSTRRVDGICRNLQTVLSQLRKQFETGKITKDKLFGKVMEVLDIFSEGNADGKVNYLYVIQSLANLYDTEKKNAILNKMRKKLGKSRKQETFLGNENVSTMTI